MLLGDPRGFRPKRVQVPLIKLTCTAKMRAKADSFNRNSERARLTERLFFNSAKSRFTGWTILSKANMVLKGIEAMSEQEFLPIIGRDRGQVLIKVIRKTRPRRILEIGTLVGYSTIMMARELDATSCLTTIENDAGRAKLARENIEKADVRPRIEVIVGDAVKVIPRLTGKFDMVFIDAEKEEYFDYLKLVEKKLH